MTKLATNGTSLDDYNYENKHIASIILDEIADVQFMGMSVSSSSFPQRAVICSNAIAGIGGF